jgi:hypothetical protein
MGISLWIPPVAGAAASAVIVLVSALTADRKTLRPVTWLGSPVRAGAAWSPSDSWVTNIAGTGAVLGAVVSSLSTLAPVVGAASVVGIVILFVVFGGAAAIAPLIYAITANRSPSGAVDPQQLAGKVWGFLLAGATSLLSVLGEIATIALVFWQVSSSVPDRVVILAVLCAGGLVVAVYSVRTLSVLSSPATPIVTGAREIVRPRSLLGSASPSATL